MPTVDLERELAALLERSIALERENKILREELAVLKQGLFGRRTEKIDPAQLSLYLNGSAPQ